MADTSFTAKVTKILATWAQAVNDWTYRGRNPNYAVTTGSANAQVLTLAAAPALGALSDGDEFTFKAGFTNTAAATLELVGSAAFNADAVQIGGVALSGGEIQSGHIYKVRRLGSTWQLYPDGSFTPSGTGATSTTVSAELLERVRPEQYGAVGDGTTLDTTALTNATSVARIVHFGQNTTYLTGTFSPVSKSVITGGKGSVIKIKDNGLSANPSLYLNAVTDVIIEGLTFTSDATSRTGVYGLIRAEGCSRLIIRNCKFLTSPSVAIYIANCSDVLIEGNEIGDGTLFPYADGIHVTRQSSRVRIIGNTIRKTQDDAIGLPSNKDSGTYTANTDIVVMGNTIDTTAGGGSGVSVIGGNNIVVMGNTVRSVSGSGITASMAGDATYNAGTDLVIAHNNIKSATLHGINIGGLNRGSVIGNVVNGTGAGNLGIQLVTTSLSVAVHGNTVTGADTGIYEEAGGGPNSFVGNILVGNTSAGALINGGTGSKISHNVGYVSTNTGNDAIASGTTSKTITHGLSKTPDAAGILVTQTNNTTNDAGSLYVDTITSTQFTVHCRSDPGVSTLTFYWRATVE